MKLSRPTHLYSAIVWYATTALLVGLGLSLLLVRALYANDYPYFKLQTVATLGLVLVAVVASLLAYNYLEKKQIPVTKKLLLGVLGASALVQLLVVFLLPLQPFSDMGNIQQAAQQIAHGNYSSLTDIGYVALYPNNGLLTFFSALLYLLFGSHTIIILKLMNILATTLTTFFAFRICTKIFKKDSLFALLVTAFFPAALLYVNHLYTDVLAATMFTGSLWFYLRSHAPKSTLVSALLLFVGTLLRAVGGIYFVAYVLYELVLRRQPNYKKLAILGVTYGVLLLGALGVAKLVLTKPISMPAASYMYVAFNPAKFGFYDGSHDTNRTYGDVGRRLQALGPRKVGTIIVKKVDWMWTEGTYETARYAIGQPGVASYKQQTILTREPARHTFGAIVEGGMYVLNAVMLLGMAFYLVLGRHRPHSEYQLLLLSIVLGFTLFYVFWEIKSRYLYSLYPFLVLFYALGLERLSRVDWRRHILLKDQSEPGEV